MKQSLKIISAVSALAAISAIIGGCSSEPKEPYSTAPLLLQLADNVLQDAAMTHVCALHGGIHTHQRRETDFFPVRANSTNAHVRGLR